MDMETAALWIAGAIVATAMASFAVMWGRVRDFTEKHAAPLRAKSPEDRTLTDKLIIEADRRADMLNIDKYEVFLENYVAAYLLDIMKRAPVVGPLVVAADYVDDMMESLKRRNPDLAASLNQSVQTATERLAGAIGKAVLKKLPPAPVQDDGWRAPRVPIDTN